MLLANFNRKEHLRHRAVSLRQHGFLVYRNRGRQRWRWADDIAEWTEMKINEVATAAEDRDYWRGILRATNTSYGGI